MMNIPHEDWKYNARGVDINRNFPSRSYVQQRPNEMPLSEAAVSYTHLVVAGQSVRIEPRSIMLLEGTAGS